MRVDAVVDGEDADGNQAPGHEDVTQEENDGDGGHGRAEEPEADPIQPSRPIFAGRHGRHDLGFRFAHQLVDGHEFKSAGTRAFDNEREGEHGSFAIAAAIVHKNDVAARLIVGAARGQVVEHGGGDLFGRKGGLVVPVLGIELVADRDVAHALRDFERLDLIFRIGLGID